MDSTVIYLSAIDNSESSNPCSISEKVLTGEPPRLGDVVDMGEARIWKVIYTEVYQHLSAQSIFVAIVAPIDSEGMIDPDNWWPISFKRDFPAMQFSINITPDHSVINYEWNCDGERDTKKIVGWVMNSEGVIEEKETGWEVHRVEYFTPIKHLSFPLFERINLCHSDCFSGVPDLIPA